MKRVLTAVGPPAWQQETAQAAGRLGEYQKGIAHWRGDKPFMPHQLKSFTRPALIIRVVASGVQTHIGAALLFGHCHAESDALFLIIRDVARGVMWGGDFIAPLYEQARLMAKSGQGSKRHSNRAAMACFCVGL